MQKKIIIGVVGTLVMVIGIYLYQKLKPAYYDEDFNIIRIYSEVDANNNGIDDYSDILLGAKIDARNHPTYDDRYWEEGYPPSDIGVCTDVIWRAFKTAGYNLREMIDRDIKKYNKEDYKLKYPDSNIDFRRVGNLYVFFSKYAESLTTDITKIEEWQPGDIVVFGTYKHIGIISDKRNKKGTPYVIHNSGQPFREEDILESRSKEDPITGHFRWNAKNIEEDIIVYWRD